VFLKMLSFAERKVRTLKQILFCCTRFWHMLNTFISFLYGSMRLLRSYFQHNDEDLRHCETFLRRGNLFVFMVIARRYDVAIFLFLVSINGLLRSYFPRNDNGLRHCDTFLQRGNLFVSQF
jgi:hypothetical protein